MLRSSYSDLYAAREETHRGAPNQEFWQIEETQEENKKYCMEKQKYEDEFLNMIAVPSENPQLCALHTWLSLNVAIIHVFEAMVNYVKVSTRNYKINQSNKTIIGFVFEENRYAEYTLHFFKHEGRIAVSLRVLDGSAFVANRFWNELTDALQEANFLEVSADEAESDSDDWELSDDEDDVEPLDLEANKYMNLEANPAVVNRWMEDLQNVDFMQHALLLLAWNAQLERNFQTMIGEGRAQILFDYCLSCLLSTTSDYCLPIARCAALLITRLVESETILVSQEQFGHLVKAVVHWTLKGNSGQHQNKVTQSEEVAQLLSGLFARLAPLSHANSTRQSIEFLYKQAPFESVRQNVAPLVEAN